MGILAALISCPRFHDGAPQMAHTRTLQSAGEDPDKPRPLI